jgi:hypothetical protein
VPVTSHNGQFRGGKATALFYVEGCLFDPNEPQCDNYQEDAAPVRIHG